jgi:hypothetical protein
MNLSSRLLSGVVTFVTVVDAGSFRGAARLLGITPSGVSRGVSRFEEQLGVESIQNPGVREMSARFWAHGEGGSCGEVGLAGEVGGGASAWRHDGD